MRFTLLFSCLLLLFSALSFADQDCRPNVLRGYLESREFNDVKKLPARLNKELRPLNKDINEAYRLGANLRQVDSELMRLKRVTPQTTKIKDQIHDLTMMSAALTREMIDVNNRFVLKMRELFKKQGIPTEVVTTVDSSDAWRMYEGANPEVAGREVLSLKFKLDSSPTPNEGFNYYRRIRSAFGLDSVTLSLSDTGTMGAGGIFFPQQGRLEVGPTGAVNLLRKYIDVTGKHESRHAMFQGKRIRGEESIFHTQFLASPNGNLLNQAQYYDQFMSAEEVYTFSTDIQSLAQVFKGDFITDKAKKTSLLSQIHEKSNGLTEVASTAKEVSAKMIQSLEKIIAQNAPVPGVGIRPGAGGAFDLSFTDELGRSAKLSFVSESEKGLLNSLQAASQKLSDSGDEYIVKRLTEEGMDVEALKKRSELGTFTEEDKLKVTTLKDEFIKLPESKVLVQEQLTSYKLILESAKTKMEKLNKIAALQIDQAKNLRRLVASGTSPEQIEEIKKLMFTIGKNVKEDYKGFGLNERI